MRRMVMRWLHPSPHDVPEVRSDHTRWMEPRAAASECAARNGGHWARKCKNGPMCTVPRQSRRHRTRRDTPLRSRAVALAVPSPWSRPRLSLCRAISLLSRLSLGLALSPGLIVAISLCARGCHKNSQSTSRMREAGSKEKLHSSPPLHQCDPITTADFHRGLFRQP